MDGLLCCFSPGGETLAIATTGDGRIRTFDTGKQNLLIVRYRSCIVCVLSALMP